MDLGDHANDTESWKPYRNIARVYMYAALEKNQDLMYMYL